MREEGPWRLPPGHPSAADVAAGCVRTVTFPLALRFPTLSPAISQDSLRPFLAGCRSTCSSDSRRRTLPCHLSTKHPNYVLTQTNEAAGKVPIQTVLKCKPLRLLYTQKTNHKVFSFAICKQYSDLQFWKWRLRCCVNKTFLLRIYEQSGNSRWHNSDFERHKPYTVRLAHYYQLLLSLLGCKFILANIKWTFW